MSELISRKEAINILQWDESTFNNKMSQGYITPVKYGKYRLADVMELKSASEIVMPVMRLTDVSQKIMCKVCYRSGLRLTERNICIDCTHKSWSGNKAINAVRSA